MTDRPMLFLAPMIQALLAGRKTQTRRLLYSRRIVKPTDAVPRNAVYDSRYPPPLGEIYELFSLSQARNIKAGDRIWVKETYRAHRTWDQYKPSETHPGDRVWYEADGRDNCDAHGKLRPSIFMPKWASRLTLTVTDVRIERLQDISDSDAQAEGIYRVITSSPADDWSWQSDDSHFDMNGDTARDGYGLLWNFINGDGAWESNPWVVAISFDVEKRNIDQ